MQTSEAKATRKEIRQRLGFVANSLLELTKDANETYGPWSEEALEIHFLWENAVSSYKAVKGR